MSLVKIESALLEQGGKKRWEMVDLGCLDRGMNDTDLLEICFYLPKLKEWTVLVPEFNLTIDGAREWKRICPDLAKIYLGGNEILSDEVIEVMEGLGITVDQY
jgi:hypothetical protein